MSTPQLSPLQSITKDLAHVYSYSDKTGYIVWRRGTGDNVELVHIKSHTPRLGHGRQLVIMMLQMLQENPPYHTIFGFTRSCNKIALNFYSAMGFQISHVNGVYKDGSALVFSQSYRTLLRMHCNAINQQL